VFDDVAYIEVTPRVGRARHSVRAAVDKPGSAAHGVTRPTDDSLTIAVEVIDIFGNDTMTLVPVTVG
jgi:hypothetical protein